MVNMIEILEVEKKNLEETIAQGGYNEGDGK